MINPRWALAPFVAVALGLLVACGGDDDGDSNATTTTQTTTSATQSSTAGVTNTGSTGAATQTSSQGTSQSGDTLDVGSIVQNLEDVQSFRFDVSLQMDFDTPEGAAGSSGSQDDAAAAAMIRALFGNIQAKGEYVAPDRYHIETTLFGMNVEVIQIGEEAWTNDGSGWTADSDAVGSLPFGNSPSDLPFDMIPAEQLEGAETSKEKVNGLDTTRYHFDKEAIAALAESSGDPEDVADLSELDTLDLNIWVTDAGIPIKMVMEAAGESEGSDVSINMEFNVSDLNDDSIKIEPPL